MIIQFGNGPHPTVDAMALLGNFGLAYVNVDNSSGGEIKPVGPCNYTNPMFTVDAGLELDPNFNMSILNANLYLCDKGIYNEIYSGIRE